MRISDWSSDVCSSDLWQRAAFNLLKEAYVKARYTTYKIGADQLQWLGEQAQELARVTEIVCCEHIAALERRVAESGAQHSNSKRAPVEARCYATPKSEERRVGREGVRSVRSLWGPEH